jgi:transposase
MRIYRDNRSVYGVRKIHHQLLHDGIRVARCTVIRLMCKLDIKGVVRGKVPRTTRPKAETIRPADLVNRTFNAERTNQHWVADITYLKAHAGWVYAVFVIDVFSCMIVGWQTSTHLYTELALDALNMAVLHQQHTGDDLSGLVHH